MHRVVQHQQVGQPEGQAVHQQAGIGGGVRLQHAGECQRFFHQAPVRRAAGTVMGHPRAHLAIEWLAGGDIDHLQATLSRQFLCQPALAGAGPAEDEFRHW
ncbi:hypothetical protein D9M73_293800 [compost metagenome]